MQPLPKTSPQVALTTQLSTSPLGDQPINPNSSKEHSTPSALKETEPATLHTKASSKVKIEDKLMRKFEASQARLKRLRALKDAEELNCLQEMPSINPLSRELASKQREKVVGLVNLAKKYGLPYAATVSKSPVMKPEIPRFKVKLEEESRTAEQPGEMSLRRIEDAELDGQMRLPRSPRNKQSTLPKNRHSDPLMRFKELRASTEPKEPLASERPAGCNEQAAGSIQEIADEEARDERTSEPKASSRQAMSLQEMWMYKQIIEDRKLLMRVKTAKTRIHRGVLRRAM